MFTEECLIIRSSKQVGQAVSPAIFGGSLPHLLTLAMSERELSEAPTKERLKI
jgi:hypothetical protein